MITKQLELLALQLTTTTVLISPNNGEGMMLWLRLTLRGELAAYIICDDGSDGCRVAFAKKEYLENDGGQRFDGCIVQLMTVLTGDSPSSDEQSFVHCIF